MLGSLELFRPSYWFGATCEAADWMCRNTNGMQSIREYLPGLAVDAMNFAVENYRALGGVVIAVGAINAAYASLDAMSKFNIALVLLLNDKHDRQIFNVFGKIGMAVKWGNLAVVNLLLEDPAVLANVAVHSYYLMRIAAQYGHFNVVNRLLDIPEFRNSAHANYNSILSYACKYLDLATVNRLVDIPEVRNKLIHDDVLRTSVPVDTYLLCWAAKNGFLAMLNRLLEKDAVRNYLNKDVINYWSYLLELAAANGHHLVVARLLREQNVLNTFNSPEGARIRAQYPDVFNKVVIDKISRVTATGALSEKGLPKDVVREIMTFAYHDVICGKRKCHAVAEDLKSTKNAQSTCLEVMKLAP